MSFKNYVSIDIETTGLDPDYCQVIEIGAVIDDWKTPVDQLARFHAYVTHGRIVGQPYGLAMNRDILAKLAQPGDPRIFLKPEDVGHYFRQWLINHYGTAFAVVAAGKNFGSFDLQFLKRLPGFTDQVVFYHRAIDPAMLYWNPEVDHSGPPSTAQCLARAGLPDLVMHTAIEDAVQVIELVRRWSIRHTAKANPEKKTAREVASELSAGFLARGQYDNG
jgi:hypothetical protein